MIDFDIRPASHPVPDAEREEKLQSPGFGQLFTDHMITLRWTAERGWHDGRLEPYGPFTLDPATSVFHYSQEFFEGLKAYRQDNGSITMFRPDANAARFNSTARRMAMPELPPETFIRALELLVAQDREWVPGGAGNSLYLRPFMIATQRGLGVNHPSSEYLFCVIASPAASYFASGVKPVTVWLSQEYTRAAPGGTGGVKTGGNYAAAFVAQQQAVEQTQQYVPPAMTGGQDLGQYGDWQQTPDYGPAWFPQVAINWAPYRYGHWGYVRPWGWTSTIVNAGLPGASSHAETPTPVLRLEIVFGAILSPLLKLKCCSSRVTKASRVPSARDQVHSPSVGS